MLRVFLGETFGSVVHYRNLEKVTPVSEPLLLGDFLLAPVCPIEKVTPVSEPLLLGDFLLAPVCPIEKVTLWVSLFY